MNANAQLIFDTNLFLKRRNKALNSQNFLKNPWFLHELAIDSAIETINFAKPNFSKALEIFSGKGQFRQAIIDNDMLGSGRKIDSLVEFEPAFSKDKKDCISQLEDLPLNGEKYDLIVLNSGLGWVNLLPEFLIKIKNSLNKDGLFIANFLGAYTLTELRDTFLKVETEEFGGVSLRVNPMIDTESGVRLLAKLGFQSPVSSFENFKVSYENIFSLFRDLKSMGESAAFYNKDAKPLNRKFIAKLADYYDANFKNEKDRVNATFDIVTLSAWI